MAVLYAQDWRDYDIPFKVFKDLDRDGEIINITSPLSSWVVPIAQSWDPNGPVYGGNSGSSSGVEASFIEMEYPDGNPFRLLNNKGNNGSSARNALGLRFSNKSDQAKSVCASFIFNTLTQLYQQNGVMFTFSRDREEIDSNTLSTSDSFFLSGLCVGTNTDGFLEVLHRVQTSNSQTNDLLLGIGPRLRSGEIYLIEVSWDISTSIGSAKLFVNGTQFVDAVFDRDRIVNGREDSSLQIVKLANSARSTGAGSSFANIVIYTDDEKTPFPLGPLEIGRISPTSGAGFEVVDYDPNASDGGWHVIAPGSEAVWQLGDIPAGNPVLFAEMRGRIAAGGGFTPAVMDIEVQRSGGAVSAATAMETPAATHERQVRFRIPDADTNIETLNGARIAVRARTEN